jgi:hypothetical protein
MNNKFIKVNVTHMFEATSLPNPISENRKKISAKLGEREVKKTSVTLHNRNIKKPREV